MSSFLHNFKEGLAIIAGSTIFTGVVISGIEYIVNRFTVDCPICKEEIESGEEFYKLKCGHIVHKYCMGNGGKKLRLK